MNQLVLKSEKDQSIKELVIAALEAERRELLTALLKTEERLSRFEERHHTATSDFVSQHKELPHLDDMEAIEWQGEYETLQRLKERLETLQEIKVCT